MVIAIQFQPGMSLVCFSINIKQQQSEWQVIGFFIAFGFDCHIIIWLDAVLIASESEMKRIKWLEHFK